MKKIFLDTDLGGDCDDVGAVALLNIFANQKKVEIVGMTHTTSSLYGPKCIDIINRYYGRCVSIGITKRTNFLDGSHYNKFAEKMVSYFGSNLDENEQLIEAYQLMRKALSELKEGEKLTFVGIGQLNNFYELISSKPDQYSSLSGYELIKENVEEVVLMAGLFSEESKEVIFEGQPYLREYNIVTDIASAKYFIEHCPVKITFIDFLAGYKVKTFGNMVEEGDMKHPVTYAYHLFSNGPRESWDPLAVYYACLGTHDLFTLSEKGYVTVDENGHTLFHKHESGLHQYVKLKQSEDKIVNVLNQLMISNKGGKI
jgi:inosine-uridine nucleoside N-ribohydrolase